MAADSISNRHGKKAKKETNKPHAARDSEDRDKQLSEEHAGFSAMADQASDYVADRLGEVHDRAIKISTGREGSVVVLGLAVGFGLGILLGKSLASPKRRPASWKDRMMAEGIGQRVMERLEEMLPAGLTDYLGR